MTITESHIHIMNPITAPEGGVVKKIIVADAQPVEFDQPLVIIG